jgi:membrane protein YqaA with SNARE-associated domain
VRSFVQALQDWGPAGVFLLAALDGLGVPMPGGVDALLVWVAITNPDAAYLAAGMAVLASILGTLVLFFIARKGGQAYLRRHAVSPRALRFERWFQEYGLLTIFVPALVPIPMPFKIFVLCAGALEVSPLAFITVLVLARIPRCFGLAWLSLRLGAQTLPYLMRHAWGFGLLALTLFACLYLLIYVLDRRRKLRQLVTDSE